MPLPDTTTRKNYVQRITAAYHRTVDSIIEIGQILQEAKDAMPHGHFEAMVKADLPFGPRQAQRLMAIARCPSLANATSRSLLPASISVLYELSRLEPEELTAALREAKRHRDEDDSTYIVKLLMKKDVERRLDRPAVTVQGVNSQLETIQESAKQPPPSAPEPPRIKTPPPRFTPSAVTHFPEAARRAPDAGIEDAQTSEVPAEPPRTTPPPPDPLATIQKHLDKLETEDRIHLWQELGRSLPADAINRLAVAKEVLLNLTEEEAKAVMEWWQEVAR